MIFETYYKTGRQWIKDHASTLRVSLSYLAVIMVMSISFSYVFYHTSSGELGRQVPPRRLVAGGTTSGGPSFVGPGNVAFGEGYQTFFQERIDEGRSHLLKSLIWMNVSVLVLGAVLSYLLARRTLEPMEAAMETQSRFASDASHELRTPLAAIQAENEVALRNPKLTLPRAKELLASNIEEAAKLRDLSETLLKLARQSNDLSRLPVALPDAASDAMNRCLKAAQQKHITIDDQVPKIEVLGDAPSITQVLVVLLDNAIKYSDEQTTITLTGGTAGKEGYIAVEDQGRGIRADDLPHVFERFYRADPARSKTQVEGHGLGLSLAAKLAEQLGGEITASSTFGQGSTFKLKLPLASKTDSA